MLAGKLAEVLRHPVFDKTGINKGFDFRIDYALDELSLEPGSDPLPSVANAVQQLGLKLESRKAPVRFLVIDSAQKPSGN